MGGIKGQAIQGRRSPKAVRLYTSLSEAEKKRIVAHLKKGVGDQACAEAFNVGRTTVFLLRHMNGIPPAKNTSLPVSEADRKKMYAYRKKGLTFKQIADKFGIAISTARANCKLVAVVEEALANKKAAGKKKTAGRKKVVPRKKKTAQRKKKTKKKKGK